MNARSYLRLLCVAVLWAMATACTAVQRIPDQADAQQGYLRLDVDPASARVFVDSEYQGVVDGWVGHVVPVDTGHRRVELRADGYVTRRFDVDIAPGAQVTLTIDMTRPIGYGLVQSSGNP